jgi:hypothetical protein
VWETGGVHTGLSWGNLRERDHLEDVGVDGRIILEWIVKGIVWEDVVWIGVAVDTDRWRAVVNAIMNFRVP